MGAFNPFLGAMIRPVNPYGTPPMFQGGLYDDPAQQDAPPDQPPQMYSGVNAGPITPRSTPPEPPPNAQPPAPDLPQDPNAGLSQVKDQPDAGINDYQNTRDQQKAMTSEAMPGYSGPSNPPQKDPDFGVAHIIPRQGPPESPSMDQFRQLQRPEAPPDSGWKTGLKTALGVFLGPQLAKDIVHPVAAQQERDYEQKRGELAQNIGMDLKQQQIKESDLRNKAYAENLASQQEARTSRAAERPFERVEKGWQPVSTGEVESPDYVYTTDEDGKKWKVETPVTKQKREMQARQELAQAIPKKMDEVYAQAFQKALAKRAKDPAYDILKDPDVVAAAQGIIDVQKDPAAKALHFESHTDDTTGNVTTIARDPLTGEEKSRTVAPGIAKKRPPVNQFNMNMMPTDASKPSSDASEEDPYEATMAKLNVPSALRSRLKRIINYQDSLPASGRNNPINNALSEWVSRVAPDYDRNKFDEIRAMRLDYAKGKPAIAQRSGNMLIHHLGTLSEAVNKLDPSRWKAYNTLDNFIKQNTDDPNIGPAKLAYDAVVHELGNLLQGGVITNEMANAIIPSLNAANGPKAAKNGIKMVADLAAGRISAAENFWAEKTADTPIKPISMISNDSKQILKSLGINPDLKRALSMQSGGGAPSPQGGGIPAGAPTATDAKGNKVWYNGTAWVPVGAK